MRRVVVLFIVGVLFAGFSPGASDEKTEKVAPLGTYKPAERRYWAFQPRKTVTPPAFTNPVDQAWVKTPVDAFILAGLQKAGLKPASQADKVTLIRRVTYDLLGLPPTPEEVDAFIADEETGAEQRVVDRLLSSPRFGERMASVWLPLARYAEDQAHQVGNDTKFFYANAYHYLGLAFFEMHKNLDVHHAAAERRIVDEAIAGDDGDAIVASTERALDAWWSFLSGIHAS